nr:Uncharacterised protein [Klebsiella pneumoniae]
MLCRAITSAAPATIGSTVRSGGAVAAVAGNRDFDGVRRGHEVAGVEAQLAYRQAGMLCKPKMRSQGNCSNRPSLIIKSAPPIASSAG